jgi:isoleucyl-tRNA synthetase
VDTPSSQAWGQPSCGPRVFADADHSWADSWRVRCQVVCIGSIEELRARSVGNVLVTDLHRESIDHIEIASSRAGAPPLRRVPEVFDCWFESGAMPYAQLHYPFENKVE